MATHPSIVNRTHLDLGRSHPMQFMLVRRDLVSSEVCLIFVSHASGYSIRWHKCHVILDNVDMEKADLEQRYRLNDITRVAAINFKDLGYQLQALISQSIQPEVALFMIHNDLAGGKRGTSALSHLSSPHFGTAWSPSELTILQSIHS